MSKTKKEVLKGALTAPQTKIGKQKETLKEVRAECRSLRKEVKRLRASRDLWKDKAVNHKVVINQQKRQLNRQKAGIYPKRHQYPTWLIRMVVFFRVYCNCSYGSIKKLLLVLQLDFVRCGEQLLLPCKQTLQNWVSKVGYYYLNQADNEWFKEDLCMIMDESVRLGNEKLFVALICPSSKLKEGHLTSDQVRVAYVAGKNSWTGEVIAEELKRVIKKKGLSVKYVVSDEGTNLKRATRLLELPHLADISHLLATCLKKLLKIVRTTSLLPSRWVSAVPNCPWGNIAFYAPTNSE